MKLTLQVIGSIFVMGLCVAGYLYLLPLLDSLAVILCAAGVLCGVAGGVCKLMGWKTWDL